LRIQRSTFASIATLEVNASFLLTLRIVTSMVYEPTTGKRFRKLSSTDMRDGRLHTSKLPEQDNATLTRLIH